MFATTSLEMPMLALAGISVAGTVTNGGRRTSPTALRAGHLVMAVAMSAMLVLPDMGSTAGVIVTAGVMVALAAAAGRVGGQISATSAALPCLVDLLGMIMICGAMALASATEVGAPAGPHAAPEHVLVIVGVAGAGLWIAAVLEFRRPASPAEPRWNKGASVASAIAMAVMLLQHA